MTSKELKKEFTECCCKSCNCTSNFIRNYPLLSTTIVSAALVCATSLVSPKSRKILLPAFKYLGKQQLKLLAGVGIFALATYITKDNDDLSYEVDVNYINSDNNEEIILTNIQK